MDVETTHAIEELGSRIDRMHADMNGEFAAVRGELADGLGAVRGELAHDIAAVRGELTGGFAAMRADIGDLRETVNTHWTRTQALFETLRDDIQMLAGHVADLASRRPRG